MSSWTAYWNGKFVPDTEICISPSDRGFILGDAVYEVARTYRHVPFHPDWHLNRLYDSLHYIRLEPLIKKSEMRDLTEEVLRRNLVHVAPDDDVILTQRVTRGPHRGPFAVVPLGPPTVLITCRPLHFAPFARLYAEGVELETPPYKLPALGGIDPRVKTHSRLLSALGAVAVAVPGRPVLPLFTDVDDRVRESTSANVFFVKDSEVLTPPDEMVLGGITRRVVLDLARQLDLRVSARPIELQELGAVDEAFIAATSFAILPVRRINTFHLRSVPGPVTARLIAAFSELVGIDIVEQALQQGSSARVATDGGAR